MKPFTNPLPKPPPPTRPRPFDPWNSSSTGHQRREGSRRETDGVSETSWRTSRGLKLNRQFRPQHAHVPASTATQDSQQQQQQPPQRKSVVDMLVKPGSMNEGASLPVAENNVGGGGGSAGRQLFDGLVVYINGSTFPLISDHKLKTALAAHGARVALHPARRQVTHVILGRPAGAGAAVGCGGGLAGTKMDREIRRLGGKGIKYVGAEWCVLPLYFPKCNFVFHTLSSFGAMAWFERRRRNRERKKKRLTTDQGPRKHPRRHTTSRGALLQPQNRPPRPVERLQPCQKTGLNNFSSLTARKYNPFSAARGKDGK